MSNQPINSSTQTTGDSRSLWQGDRNSTDVVGRLGQQFVRFLWCILLLGALALFAWFIWLLLLAPKRTPMVVFSAAPYQWPLPPNDWETEDVEQLAGLDGETISLRANTTPILKKSDFLTRLDQEVDRSEASDDGVPLLVWVSLHGIVDETEDKVCLIPPNGSPVDPETWIELDAIIDRLEEVDQRRQTLLILDCSRMQVNWHIGLTSSRVAEKIQSAYENRIKDDPNRNTPAILLAAGAQQLSIASAELNGSVFGHYFQLGLAGQADRQSETGNGDGWVDLNELHQYVEENVTKWAWRNRGRLQTPVLLTSKPGTAINLARSLNVEDLGELVQERSSMPRSASTLSSSQLDPLWKSLDDMRTRNLYQREPIAFRDFEHDLLWLEQLSMAGKGYRTLARRTLERVGQQVRAIQARVLESESTPTYAGTHSIISGNPPALPRALQVHSLELASWLGTQPFSVTQSLRGEFTRWTKQPDSLVLTETLEAFDSNANSDYANAHFMHMLARYQTPRLWSRSPQVGRLSELQSQISRLAVPKGSGGSDLRSHYWSRALMTDVDAARRDAEDFVFLDQQPGLGEKVQQALAAYDSAVGQIALADRARLICDHSMASLPYFAQWVGDPRRNVDSEQTTREINETILPLIESTAELAGQLASAGDHANDPTAAGDAIREIERLANEKVASQLESLQSQWERQLQQLVFDSESNRVDVINEIEAVLSVPLTDWKYRRDLRDALGRMSRRMHQGFDGSEEGPIVAEASKDTYTKKISGWDRHPLNVLLQREPDAVDSSWSRVDQFRRRSAKLVADSLQESSLGDRRNQCGDAARRTRLAASLWFVGRQTDAIGTLRQADLQSLLLWHANRCLQDFWGPAGNEKSFYDVATSDYCRAVSDIQSLNHKGQDSSEQIRELVEMQSLLDSSRRSLDNWLTTTSGRTIQLDPKDPFQSSFVVTAESEVGYRPTFGTASIVVRTESRRIEVPNMEPSDALSLPAADAEYLVNLPAELADVEEPLFAQTIFRGHEFGGDLDVQQLGGVTVEVRPPVYKHSDVTLSGPWDKLSVMFVIDCSASMGEPLSSEGQEAAQSRLDIAKSALQSLLMNLGLRRNVRVGVRAFGHRLGWSVDEPLRVLSRPGLTAPVDPAVTPSQDVESVLPLGDFELATAQTVIPEISEVMPWGQSPLYLSVQQSLEEFSEEDRRADRHVIVITDGANYQFIPPNVFTAQMTTENDVREAWKLSNAPVHILGLGMDRTDQNTAIAEFSQLCFDTGGRFQALSGSTDLAEALRELLSPGGYLLSPLQSDQRPEQSASLGTSVRVAPVPTSPETFGLIYQGRRYVDPQAEPESPSVVEPLVFRGGESTQLYVNEQGTEIYAYPFEENQVAISDLVTINGSSADHVIRAHRPDRRPGGRVIFPISWQRRDTEQEIDEPLWRATDRPERFWIRVQPYGAGGKPVGSSYVFFDQAYEADQPVPVMNLTADDWPEDATRAMLQVWSNPPEPVSGIELLAPGNVDDVAQTTSRINKLFEINDSLANPVEVASGVMLRSDPLGSSSVGEFARRRFVVEFTDASLDVTSIKLDVKCSPRERPIRIVRQFDPIHRMSVHTFYYPADQREFPEEIMVTNQDHETEGAWQQYEDSLIVPIPESGGLLPVVESVLE